MLLYFKPFSLQSHFFLLSLSFSLSLVAALLLLLLLLRHNLSNSPLQLGQKKMQSAFTLGSYSKNPPFFSF